jgi:hypothetical protein
MGVRSDKTNALTRYLGAASGIPGVTREGYGIHLRKPYSVDVFTGSSTRMLHESIRDALVEDGLPIHLWYSRLVHADPGEALASMRLRQFAQLLNAHYESVVLPRERQGE